ncbi:hypothetical protein CEUSTIGMA_g4696.t1 [Chlamydomonas eustigma]|uniref:t-SNARE coiled-coil homology domain-containing protein n=1 Tax=Chlamydomonas eustigma TaxID=1157962 RepID=A0A250X3A2_9CHLO|nr:hypothetical protein CEUSTIGMA_g4696.t1 [Chlamydomonas eustigma]|eukprot:GAX77250.1 hypothetical protein CEUSTIGMA_g4696.t1 [Chlamydomonas eustigma]
MSYKDLALGRGQSVAGTTSSPEIQSIARTIRQIESEVFRLASSLSQLKRLVDTLGTPKDTVDHRHRIKDINSTIQQQSKLLKEKLTSLHDESNGRNQTEPQVKIKKLMQDFASILLDYKGIQKIIQERESSSLPRPNAVASTSGKTTVGASHLGAGSPLLDIEHGIKDEELEKKALLQQQQNRQSALLNNAIEFNEALIEERDQGIQEIARQIGEVNEMFQDLAVLINDQGTQVQTIDEHITATAERAKEGARELVKAERSQRSVQNKCLWIWLIAAVVVSVVIILVLG